jgi:hypothetical protein
MDFRVQSFMSMKTLEFKLNLTPEQKEARDPWVSGLRWVWNTGLEFLENFYPYFTQKNSDDGLK